MKSQIPKAMHTLCSRPMLGFVLDLARGLNPAKTIAVLGYKHEEVRKLIPAGIKIILQKKLLGTGDAVKQALSQLKGFKGTCLVLYADNPLLKKETIKKLVKYHIDNKIDATLLTAVLEKPAGYGRILRDKYASISGIIEEKDADEVQKNIKEINTGIICFDAHKLSDALKRIRPDNRKREYYLTDAIGVIYKNKGIIDRVKIDDINEALGINSRAELAKAGAIMQARVNEKFMEEGVSIVNPASAFIGFDAKIGKDSVIYPFTVIEKGVKIGKRCSIGPFAHLREGTVIGNDCLIGNFLETVRSRFGSKTLLKHFSYIGDSVVGNSVNIGAGVVTANFDGKNKFLTAIKDKAFIGSDTVIVAPAQVGRGARTGAGSVITRNANIPDNAVVVGVPARILKQPSQPRRLGKLKARLNLRG